MAIREKRNRSIVLIVIGMFLLLSTITSLLFALNVFKSNKKIDNKIGTLANSNSVTIRFNNNNGYGGQKSNITAIYNKKMPKLSTLNPTKKGYTFMGWYDNSDYTKGKQYYKDDGTSTRVLDRNKTFTLYAGWKKNTYLTGNTLIQFKKDNNLNIDSNIVITKHSKVIKGSNLDYYLVYNKNSFTEAQYNKLLQYVNHSFSYISKVNSKIINFVNKYGFDIVFLGHYDCDNGDKEVGYSTFAAYCNSYNRNIVIGYDDEYLNDSFYEGSVIHEMGHLYDITLRYVISSEKEKGITGLSSKEITNGYTINSNSRDVSKYASKTISASSLKPLFLFKGNTPYTWGELAKSYASVLIDAFEKAKLTPGFSIYSKKDLSNSGLEFYAELFNAYFWSSEYRNLAQKTAPVAFDALIKSFSYVNE